MMQKGRKWVLENSLWHNRPKQEVRLQNEKKKKVPDHNVLQILKVNKNMLTLNLPANDTAIGSLKM